jgi:maltose alpha-D-glucosyltransferase/alpha-amylase
MFSMPGTPVLYYGDEIAMGDNIFLGDRDGVRTPMQWSPDRNGGFSRADPAQLYLPPIMDAVYGYESVNVEAQARSPGSYLNWMKRLIAVRKARVAFGRGDLQFIYPTNRKVLAYLRTYGEETILCVFNLSRSPQAVELDLAGYKGRGLTELGGLSNFPPVGDLPYLLTLSGFSFYWFLLTAEATVDQAWRAPPALPEFLTLVMQAGWASLFDRHTRRQVEQEVLPAFLPNQRWFAGKDRRIAGVSMRAHASLDAPGGGWLLTVIEVALRGAEPQRYALPLAMSWADSESEQRMALLPSTLAQARHGRAEGAIYDAGADPEFTLALVQAITDGRRLPAGDGEIVFFRSDAFAGPTSAGTPSVKRIGGEQSNSSLLIEEYAVLKLYRRLVSGVHPEVEMAGFLTDAAGFTATPPLLGAFRLQGGELGDTALGVLFANVRNQGDAWEQALNYLSRYLDEALLMAPREAGAAGDAPRSDQTSHQLFLELAAQLGRRTAELHRALCPEGPADDAFAPEPLTETDVAAWHARATKNANATLDNLARRRDSLPEGGQEIADRVLALRDRIVRQFDDLLQSVPAAMKTRLHGDYHLGQVLVVQNDYSIIDFEGEPSRPLDERRRKTSPLVDVAGMMRSYAYASATGLRRMTDIQPAAATQLGERAEEWRRQVTEAFLTRYLAVMDGAASLPCDRETVEAMLSFFMLEKALYEVDYELAFRPTWTTIPLAGILAIVDAREVEHVDA